MIRSSFSRRQHFVLVLMLVLTILAFSVNFSLAQCAAGSDMSTYVFPVNTQVGSVDASRVEGNPPAPSSDLVAAIINPSLQVSVPTYTQFPIQWSISMTPFKADTAIDGVLEWTRESWKDACDKLSIIEVAAPGVVGNQLVFARPQGENKNTRQTDTNWVIDWQSVADKFITSTGEEEEWSNNPWDNHFDLDECYAQYNAIDMGDDNLTATQITNQVYPTRTFRLMAISSSATGSAPFFLPKDSLTTHTIAYLSRCTNDARPEKQGPKSHVDYAFDNLLEPGVDHWLSRNSAGSRPKVSRVLSHFTWPKHTDTAFVARPPHTPNTVQKAPLIVQYGEEKDGKIKGSLRFGRTIVPVPSIQRQPLDIVTSFQYIIQEHNNQIVPSQIKCRQIIWTSAGVWVFKNAQDDNKNAYKFDSGSEWLRSIFFILPVPGPNEWGFRAESHLPSSSQLYCTFELQVTDITQPLSFDIGRYALPARDGKPFRYLVQHFDLPALPSTTSIVVPGFVPTPGPDIATLLSGWSSSTYSRCFTVAGLFNLTIQKPSSNDNDDGIIEPFRLLDDSNGGGSGDNTNEEEEEEESGVYQLYDGYQLTLRFKQVHADSYVQIDAGEPLACTFTGDGTDKDCEVIITGPALIQNIQLVLPRTPTGITANKDDAHLIEWFISKEDVSKLCNNGNNGECIDTDFSCVDCPPEDYTCLDNPDYCGLEVGGEFPSFVDIVNDDSTTFTPLKPDNDKFTVPDSCRLLCSNPNNGGKYEECPSEADRYDFFYTESVCDSSCECSITINECTRLGDTIVNPADSSACDTPTETEFELDVIGDCMACDNLFWGQTCSVPPKGSFLKVEPLVVVDNTNNNNEGETPEVEVPDVEVEVEAPEVEVEVEAQYKYKWTDKVRFVTQWETNPNAQITLQIKYKDDNNVEQTFVIYEKTSITESDVTFSRDTGISTINITTTNTLAQSWVNHHRQNTPTIGIEDFTFEVIITGSSNEEFVIKLEQTGNSLEISYDDIEFWCLRFTDNIKPTVDDTRVYELCTTHLYEQSDNDEYVYKHSDYTEDNALIAVKCLAKVNADETSSNVNLNICINELFGGGDNNVDNTALKQFEVEFGNQLNVTKVGSQQSTILTESVIGYYFGCVEPTSDDNANGDNDNGGVVILQEQQQPQEEEEILSGKPPKCDALPNQEVCKQGHKRVFTCHQITRTSVIPADDNGGDDNGEENTTTTTTTTQQVTLPTFKYIKQGVEFSNCSSHLLIDDEEDQNNIVKTLLDVEHTALSSASLVQPPPVADDDEEEEVPPPPPVFSYESDLSCEWAWDNGDVDWVDVPGQYCQHKPEQKRTCKRSYKNERDTITLDVWINTLDDNTPPSSSECKDETPSPPLPGQKFDDDCDKRSILYCDNELSYNYTSQNLKPIAQGKQRSYCGESALVTTFQEMNFKYENDDPVDITQCSAAEPQPQPHEKKTWKFACQLIDVESKFANTKLSSLNECSTQILNFLTRFKATLPDDLKCYLSNYLASEADKLTILGDADAIASCKQQHDEFNNGNGNGSNNVQQVGDDNTQEGEGQGEETHQEVVNDDNDDGVTFFEFYNYKKCGSYQYITYPADTERETISPTQPTFNDIMYKINKADCEAEKVDWNQSCLGSGQTPYKFTACTARSNEMGNNIKLHIEGTSHINETLTIDTTFNITCYRYCSTEETTFADGDKLTPTERLNVESYQKDKLSTCLTTWDQSSDETFDSTDNHRCPIKPSSTQYRHCLVQHLDLTIPNVTTILDIYNTIEKIPLSTCPNTCGNGNEQDDCIDCLCPINCDNNDIDVNNHCPIGCIPQCDTCRSTDNDCKSKCFNTNIKNDLSLCYTGTDDVNTPPPIPTYKYDDDYESSIQYTPIRYAQDWLVCHACHWWMNDTSRFGWGQNCQILPMIDSFTYYIDGNNAPALSDELQNIYNDEDIILVYRYYGSPYNNIKVRAKYYTDNNLSEEQECIYNDLPFIIINSNTINNKNNGNPTNKYSPAGDYHEPNKDASDWVKDLDETFVYALKIKSTTLRDLKRCSIIDNDNTNDNVGDEYNIQNLTFELIIDSAVGDQKRIDQQRNDDDDDDDDNDNDNDDDDNDDDDNGDGDSSSNLFETIPIVFTAEPKLTFNFINTETAQFEWALPTGSDNNNLLPIVNNDNDSFKNSQTDPNGSILTTIQHCNKIKYPETKTIANNNKPEDANPLILLRCVNKDKTLLPFKYCNENDHIGKNLLFHNVNTNDNDIINLRDNEWNNIITNSLNINNIIQLPFKCIYDDNNERFLFFSPQQNSQFNMLTRAYEYNYNDICDNNDRIFTCFNAYNIGKPNNQQQQNEVLSLTQKDIIGIMKPTIQYAVSTCLNSPRHIDPLTPAILYECITDNKLCNNNNNNNFGGCNVNECIVITYNYPIDGGDEGQGGEGNGEGQGGEGNGEGQGGEGNGEGQGGEGNGEGQGGEGNGDANQGGEGQGGEGDGNNDDANQGGDNGNNGEQEQPFIITATTTTTINNNKYFNRCIDGCGINGKSACESGCVHECPIDCEKTRIGCPIGCYVARSTTVEQQRNNIQHPFFTNKELQYIRQYKSLTQIHFTRSCEYELICNDDSSIFTPLLSNNDILFYDSCDKRPAEQPYNNWFKQSIDICTINYSQSYACKRIIKHFAIQDINNNEQQEEEQFENNDLINIVKFSECFNTTRTKYVNGFDLTLIPQDVLNYGKNANDNDNVDDNDNNYYYTFTKTDHVTNNEECNSLFTIRCSINGKLLSEEQLLDPYKHTVPCNDDNSDLTFNIIEKCNDNIKPHIEERYFYCIQYDTQQDNNLQSNIVSLNKCKPELYNLYYNEKLINQQLYNSILEYINIKIDNQEAEQQEGGIIYQPYIENKITPCGIWQYIINDKNDPNNNNIVLDTVPTLYDFAGLGYDCSEGRVTYKKQCIINKPSIPIDNGDNDNIQIVDFSYCDLQESNQLTYIEYHIPVECVQYCTAIDKDDNVNVDDNNDVSIIINGTPLNIKQITTVINNKGLCTHTWTDTLNDNTNDKYGCPIKPQAYQQRYCIMFDKTNNGNNAMAMFVPLEFCWFEQNPLNLITQEITRPSECHSCIINYYDNIRSSNWGINCNEISRIETFNYLPLDITKMNSNNQNNENIKLDYIDEIKFKLTYTGSPYNIIKIWAIMNNKRYEIPASIINIKQYQEENNEKQDLYNYEVIIKLSELFINFYKQIDNLIFDATLHPLNNNNNNNNNNIVLQHIEAITPPLQLEPLKFTIKQRCWSGVSSLESLTFIDHCEYNGKCNRDINECICHITTTTTIDGEVDENGNPITTTTQPTLYIDGYYCNISICENDIYKNNCPIERRTENICKYNDDDNIISNTPPTRDDIICDCLHYFEGTKCQDYRCVDDNNKSYCTTPGSSCNKQDGTCLCDLDSIYQYGNKCENICPYINEDTPINIREQCGILYFVKDYEIQENLQINESLLNVNQFITINQSTIPILTEWINYNINCNDKKPQYYLSCIRYNQEDDEYEFVDINSCSYQDISLQYINNINNNNNNNLIINNINNINNNNNIYKTKLNNLECNKICTSNQFDTAIMNNDIDNINNNNGIGGNTLLSSDEYNFIFNRRLNNCELQWDQQNIKYCDYNKPFTYQYQYCTIIDNIQKIAIYINIENCQYPDLPYDNIQPKYNNYPLEIYNINNHYKQFENINNIINRKLSVYDNILINEQFQQQRIIFKHSPCHDCHYIHNDERKYNFALDCIGQKPTVTSFRYGVERLHGNNNLPQIGGIIKNVYYIDIINFELQYIGSPYNNLTIWVTTPDYLNGIPQKINTLLNPIQTIHGTSTYNLQWSGLSTIFNDTTIKLTKVQFYITLGSLNTLQRITSDMNDGTGPIYLEINQRCWYNDININDQGEEEIISRIDVCQQNDSSCPLDNISPCQCNINNVWDGFYCTESICARTNCNGIERTMENSDININGTNDITKQCSIDLETKKPKCLCNEQYQGDNCEYYTCKIKDNDTNQWISKCQNDSLCDKYTGNCICSTNNKYQSGHDCSQDICKQVVLTPNNYTKTIQEQCGVLRYSKINIFDNNILDDNTNITSNDFKTKFLIEPPTILDYQNENINCDVSPPKYYEYCIQLVYNEDEEDDEEEYYEIVPLSTCLQNQHILKNYTNNEKTRELNLELNCRAFCMDTNNTLINNNIGSIITNNDVQFNLQQSILYGDCSRTWDDINLISCDPTISISTQYRHCVVQQINTLYSLKPTPKEYLLTSINNCNNYYNTDENNNNNVIIQPQPSKYDNNGNIIEYNNNINPNEVIQVRHIKPANCHLCHQIYTNDDERYYNWGPQCDIKPKFRSLSYNPIGQLPLRKGGIYNTINYNDHIEIVIGYEGSPYLDIDIFGLSPDYQNGKPFYITTIPGKDTDDEKHNIEQTLKYTWKDMKYRIQSSDALHKLEIFAQIRIINNDNDMLLEQKPQNNDDLKTLISQDLWPKPQVAPLIDITSIKSDGSGLLYLDIARRCVTYQNVDLCLNDGVCDITTESKCHCDFSNVFNQGFLCELSICPTLNCNNNTFNQADINYQCNMIQINSQEQEQEPPQWEAQCDCNYAFTGKNCEKHTCKDSQTNDDLCHNGSVCNKDKNDGSCLCSKTSVWQLGQYCTESICPTLQCDETRVIEDITSYNTFTQKDELQTCIINNIYDIDLNNGDNILLSSEPICNCRQNQFYGERCELHKCTNVEGMYMCHGDSICNTASNNINGDCLCQENSPFSKGLYCQDQCDDFCTSGRTKQLHLQIEYPLLTNDNNNELDEKYLQRFPSDELPVCIAKQQIDNSINSSIVTKSDDVVCQCSFPYTGQHCELQHCNNRQGELTCQNNSTCNMLDGTCQCNPTLPFFGQYCTQSRCETELQCIPQNTNIDPNTGELCSVIDITTNKIACNCKPGFKGERCEIQHCDLLNGQDGCQHNTQCDTTRGVCQCDVNNIWEGRYCEKSRCDSLQCNPYNSIMNQDTEQLCEINTNTKQPECKCKPGFTGPRCDDMLCVSIDTQEEITCQHNSQCNAQNGQCICDKNSIYQLGRFCEKSICPSIGCHIEGTIINNNNDQEYCSVIVNNNNNNMFNNNDQQFQCKCKPGWTGPLCNQRHCGLNNDGTSKCQNGSTCDIDTGKCVCDKFSVFQSGEYCQESICSTLGCTKGRTGLVEGSNQSCYIDPITLIPKCNCLSSYEGEQCELTHCKDVNTGLDKCKNGSVCDKTKGTCTCVKNSIFQVGDFCQSSLCPTLECEWGHTIPTAPALGGLSCYIDDWTQPGKFLPKCNCNSKYYFGEKCELRYCVDIEGNELCNSTNNNGTATCDHQTGKCIELNLPAENSAYNINNNNNGLMIITTIIISTLFITLF